MCIYGQVVCIYGQVVCIYGQVVCIYGQVVCIYGQVVCIYGLVVGMVPCAVPTVIHYNHNSVCRIRELYVWLLADTFSN